MAQKDLERMMSGLASVLASGVKTPQLSTYYVATEMLKKTEERHNTTTSSPARSRRARLRRTARSAAGRCTCGRVVQAYRVARDAAVSDCWRTACVRRTAGAIRHAR